MVVSRHVEISFYRGGGRTRGRGFGALAKVLGRTAIPSFRTYIVAAAKRVGADLLEIAAPEFADVVKGANKFELAAKNAARQTVRKPVGIGRRKKKCKESHFNKLCKTNQSVAKRQFYKHFSLIMSSSFWYQPFVTVSGIPGGKVPGVDIILSSHEQELHPSTSLAEGYIEFEFQTDRNYNIGLRQTYLALKLKFVKSLGYETYQHKQV